MNSRYLGRPSDDPDSENTHGQRPISETITTSATMATSVHPPPLISTVSSHFAAERPRLPPLSHIPNATITASTSPLVKPGSAGTYHVPPLPVSNSLAALLPPTNPGPKLDQRPPPTWKVYPKPAHSADRNYETPQHSQNPVYQLQGVKRHWSEMDQPSERPPRQPSTLPPLSTSSSFRAPLQSKQPSLSHPLSATGSVSEPDTPNGTQSSASVRPIVDSRSQSVTSSASNTHRCSLYLRQQPRAARAGPDGKDRRLIDPPPVVQLLMLDFDPTSERDVHELKSHSWVVHTSLVSAQSPRSDITSVPSVNDDGSRGQVTRLLLGTTVSSPFFSADDPDPDRMPQHPTSVVSRPPSPSTRFLPTSSQRPAQAEAPRNTSIPSTFFIFADLSVRKAGEYRLEFRLMRMEASNLVAGSRVPIIHSITSEVFRVVNAKDFDQVKPSTELVKGLVDRGAGFPLKLKKGPRRSGRRRQEGDPDMLEEQSDNESDDDEGDV